VNREGKKEKRKRKDGQKIERDKKYRNREKKRGTTTNTDKQT
jgi:hypothetical protein